MKRETSFLVIGFIFGVLIATCGFAWFLKVTKSKTSMRNSEIVIKLGHPLDTSHPVHRSLEYMKQQLAIISSGKVNMDIYSSGVLGSSVECLEQLRNGSLPMTTSSTANMENFVPEMAIFGYPYLFRNKKHYFNVLKGPVGRQLLIKGDEKGIRGLCYFDAGSRNFYTKNTPVKNPDDLKGLKIRVMNSGTSIEMVKSFGAAPTPIAWGELYTALAQGTVDAAENNPTSFTTNKHYEVCKHFTFDAHTRIPDVLLISSKIWQGFTPQVQSWIQQAADKCSTYQHELWRKETEKAILKAQNEGVTFYKVDQTLFADKVKPMYEQLNNKKMIELINTIKEQ